MNFLLFILGYIIGNLAFGITLTIYAIRKSKKNKKALEGLKNFLEVNNYENKENN